MGQGEGGGGACDFEMGELVILKWGSRKEEKWGSRKEEKGR